MFITILCIIVCYLIFVCVKLGLTERVPLACRSISLEQIPAKAARKYGNRILFTTDKPVNWVIPGMASCYPHQQSWSAVNMEETINGIAKMIQPLIARDDRVAICKENHLDFHFFMQAIIQAGGIACPMNNKFTASHFQPYLSHIGSKVLIIDSVTLKRILDEGGSLGGVSMVVLAEKKESGGNPGQDFISGYLKGNAGLRWMFLEECPMCDQLTIDSVKRKKEDVFYLVHSSGTTGFPKAVILKNAAQSHAVKGWLCYVHVSRFFDRALVAVPCNHQAVILTFNGCLSMGLRVHWSSGYDQYTFEAESVMQQLAKENFTGFFAFPVAYTLLKEIPLDKYPANRMRFWASTADATHETILRHFVKKGAAFKSLGIPLQGAVYMDAQGSSEVGTPSVLRYVSRFTNKFERRIGRPGSTPFGPSIRIRTAYGSLAKEGQVGKLEVKGKTLFGGYWNNDEGTKQAFTDGWFFTADVARRSRDGHIVQLDRLVDVIRTRYGDVYSLLIEEKIHQHPAVFDACVYGAFQADGTQLPAVAVALRTEYNTRSEELLLEAFNAMLSSEEQLVGCKVLPWSDFPIGVTGKTLKRVFRENSKEQYVRNSEDASAGVMHSH